MAYMPTLQLPFQPLALMACGHPGAGANGEV